MERCDQDLAFMLQYENVAWYENGKVRILDRRIYPTEVKFVECTTYKEVAQAITDMVTQSAGPYTAAGMGMALAAHEVEGNLDLSDIIHEVHFVDGDHFVVAAVVGSYFTCKADNSKPYGNYHRRLLKGCKRSTCRRKKCSRSMFQQNC